jgi:phosphate-selective porin OprO/OprP
MPQPDPDPRPEPTPASDAAKTAPPNAATGDADKPASLYDRIWRAADVYRDDQNPVLQRLRFTGRFQLDYARVAREDFEDWVIRRFRLGGEATLFRELTLHGEVDLQPQEREVYQRLTGAYLAWSRNEHLTVTVGKHSARFTLDGSTSSTELLAIDRANLANNLWFPQEYFPGVSVSGRANGWRYALGVFSSGSATPEFGRFDGGEFVLTTLGYDFPGKSRRTLTINYVHNEPHRNNTFTRALSDVMSLNFVLEDGRWGLRGDVSGALGYGGQSDLWGAMLMPSFKLTPALQAVARFTWVASRDPNGVRFARYENQVVSGRGDAYGEVYLGLNWYLYGHKLKLQTGAQYADMRDRAGDGGAYSGWAWTSGLRIAW